MPEIEQEQIDDMLHEISELRHFAGSEMLMSDFQTAGDMRKEIVRLRARVEELRPALIQPAVPEEALVEGLAGTALAARRILGITPYPVQIAGALALSRGLLAEMATGEGKTFTVALSAALQGLTRLPCHVVTANDYLASRDAEDLASFYAFFGLASASVGSDGERYWALILGR